MEEVRRVMYRGYALSPVSKHLPSGAFFEAIGIFDGEKLLTFAAGYALAKHVVDVKIHFGTWADKAPAPESKNAEPVQMREPEDVEQMCLEI